MTIESHIYPNDPNPLAVDDGELNIEHPVTKSVGAGARQCLQGQIKVSLFQAKAKRPRANEESGLVQDPHKISCEKQRPT